MVKASQRLGRQSESVTEKGKDELLVPTAGLGCVDVVCYFFFQAEDGIRDLTVTGVQTCALPISSRVASLGVLPQRYGTSTFNRRSSAFEISWPFRRRRRRFGRFASSRWLFHPLCRLSFPEAVFLSRLAAPRFVFIFGMLVLRGSQCCALGERTMCSIRPSIRGLLSTVAMSCTASTIFCSIFQPSSVWAISRPLKRTVTFALWPSSRNRRTCFTLKSKSCLSVLGPIFTSLTWIVVCFLRASLRRRACVYLYLPKSMIRQTGGWASGATSTRSNSRWRAVSSACWIGMIPSCSPSALTTRTSRTRIPSLIRISLA